MIFVTVGTHEQPFNRLVEYIDKLKEKGKIEEEVIIQTGYSTYQPQLVEEARIVITHGGPSSFIMPLQIGKTPIVVPRQYKFGEHVNDHQVAFVKEVANRMGTIIAVTDIEKLEDTINSYDSIIREMHGNTSSNNAKFNNELENIVKDMFKEKFDD